MQVWCIIVRVGGGCCVHNETILGSDWRGSYYVCVCMCVITSYFSDRMCCPLSSVLIIVHIHLECLRERCECIMVCACACVRACVCVCLQSNFALQVAHFLVSTSVQFGTVGKTVDVTTTGEQRATAVKQNRNLSRGLCAPWCARCEYLRSATGVKKAPPGC